MDNLINQGFDIDGRSVNPNPLRQYVQTMAPEAIAQISGSVSGEAIEMMEGHIVSLLGGLPGDRFGVTITTSREALGQLMAASMMKGYFLRGAEQRLAFEQSLPQLDPSAEAEQ
jgi:hypothetical protein